MVEETLAQNAEIVRHKMLSVWINNFQLKDKLQLIEALRDEEMHVPFAIAVEQFLDGFEQSFSVDAPYPKRIGRWVGLYAPQLVIDRLIVWAQTGGTHPTAARYRLEFRSALEAAMNIDRSSRPPIFEAA
ncbi:MAG: hypothetical protein ACRCU5_10085 [Rhizobiaceae bacterium]